MEQEPALPTVDGLFSSIKQLLSPHDMKRLEAYTNNLVDFHLVRSLNNCIDCILYIFFISGRTVGGWGGKVVHDASSYGCDLLLVEADIYINK